MTIDINNITRLFKYTDNKSKLLEKTNEFISYFNALPHNEYSRKHLLRHLRLKFSSDNTVFLNYELLHSLIRQHMPEELTKYEDDFYSLTSIHDTTTQLNPEDTIFYRYWDSQDDRTVLLLNNINEDILDDGRYIEISREIIINGSNSIRIDYSNNYINGSWFSVGQINPDETVEINPKIVEFMNNWFNLLKNDIVPTIKNKQRSKVMEIYVPQILGDKNTLESLNIVKEHMFNTVQNQRVKIHNKIFPEETKKFINSLSAKDIHFKQEYGSNINSVLNDHFESRSILNEVNNVLNR